MEGKKMKVVLSREINVDQRKLFATRLLASPDTKYHVLAKQMQEAHVKMDEPAAVPPASYVISEPGSKWLGVVGMNMQCGIVRVQYFCFNVALETLKERVQRGLFTRVCKYAEDVGAQVIAVHCLCQPMYEEWQVKFRKLATNVIEPELFSEPKVVIYSIPRDQFAKLKK